MSDPTKANSLTETLDVLGTKTLVAKAYDDLLQPAARELGKDLAVVARAVSIALAPIEATVWGYEKIRSWLSAKVTERLANVEPAAIQPPPLNIAGPTILSLTFASEIPELRDLYANLLASAMNKATANTAHPAFVQIIEQLSPDEAKVLHLLAGSPDDEICCEVTSELGSIHDGSEFNFIQWEKFCALAGVECLENSGSYLDNLLRLRVLAEHVSTKARLCPEGSNEYGDWADHVDQTTERSIYLTEFGHRFLSACVDCDELRP